MPLDRLVLIVLCVLGAILAIAMLAGAVLTFPYSIVALVVYGFIAYLIYRVIKERLNDPEDDYYSKNVDK